MGNGIVKIPPEASSTPKEKTLHEHGLVGVLRSLHDELDAAVLAAYGWGDLHPITDPDALLARLVRLNAQCATEEAAGNVRWLRPALQVPGQAQQTGIVMLTQAAAPANKGKGAKSASAQPWPATMAEQVKAVADVLAKAGTALDLDAIAAHFSSRGRWRERLPSILDTLVALGRIHAQSPTLWVNVS